MRTEINIGIIDAFTFTASFLAIYISFFIIKNSKNNKGNLYQGIFLLSFALGAVQEFLNNTGYITHMLYLTCVTEPLRFVVSPALYLYTAYSLEPKKKRRDWLHFMFPLFWTLYMGFFFAQSDNIKYNNYISLKHPDWEYMNSFEPFSDDPIGIRDYGNAIIVVISTIYIIAACCIIFRKFREQRQSLWRCNIKPLSSVRNSLFHFIIITAAYGILKAAWGIKSDVGLIVITYLCIYIFLISYEVINNSTYFSQSFSILDYSAFKYQKSSLTEEQKDEILKYIRHEMDDNHYFTSNLSSLAGLAKQIKSSQHHVSQVINERLGQTFYEMLASYRINYAKKLMQDDENSNLTIEEIAEMSGYNAKSSFNTAFKKQMEVTPSEYRKKIRGKVS